MHLSLLLFLLCQGPTATLDQVPASFLEARAAYVATGDAPFGKRLVAIGSVFRGVPYVAHTLDQSEVETLVVKLDGMDCFTFVENCLAMACTFRKQGGYPEFLDVLQRIRYRDGLLAGYPSRLHYTSDWSIDNARKGFLRDVTAEIGGEPYPKRIDFMSQHRGSYPQLADDAHYAAIQQVESALAGHAFSYIPETRLADMEAKIEEGDILALTSTVEGLDIAHVGFATFVAGRLHLLNASSLNKRVEIMEATLVDYLLASSSRHGVMVFRPL